MCTILGVKAQKIIGKHPCIGQQLHGGRTIKSTYWMKNSTSVVVCLSSLSVATTSCRKVCYRCFPDPQVANRFFSERYTSNRWAGAQHVKGFVGELEFSKVDFEVGSNQLINILQNRCVKWEVDDLNRQAGTEYVRSVVCVTS